MNRSAGEHRAVFLVAVMIALAVAGHPAAAQVVTEFAVPSGGEPLHIAPGPGGMWFTQKENRIGLITSEGRVTEFSIKRPAWRIVAGPDGNLWFTSDGFLSRMTPAGEVTDFPLSGRAWGITVGPDQNIWFTELQGNGPYGILGHATTDGQVTEVLINSWAEDITAGPDGNFWVPDWTEFCWDAIVRVTPSGGETRFALPGGLNCAGDTGPSAVTVGSDGNIWFAQARSAQIGRITPSGAITVFDAPGEFDIAAGPDGNLWFTEYRGNKIGRLTPGGKLAEYPLLANPWGIGAGPDGNIWFTEPRQGRIGRINLQIERAQPRLPGRVHSAPGGPPGPRR